MELLLLVINMLSVLYCDINKEDKVSQMKIWLFCLLSINISTQKLTANISQGILITLIVPVYGDDASSVTAAVCFQ
jgi:hypothetical protein